MMILWRSFFQNKIFSNLRIRCSLILCEKIKNCVDLFQTRIKNLLHKSSGNLMRIKGLDEMQKTKNKSTKA